MKATTPFYVVGGTVPRDAPSYIARQADAELLEGLRQGQFCYVLTSRQMGKSSLMVRTAARLSEEGVAVASLDLTAVGQNLTVEQWYDGLLHLLARALDVEDALEDFWLGSERYSPLQRWMLALREVVLERIPGKVVLFVDEIDAVRSLPFSADEFFAAIRECYNRRTQDPEYCRLTFCLLGVATPSDLIRDTRTTPFNIGRRIELGDFTEAEAAPLASGLEYWSNGVMEHASKAKPILQHSNTPSLLARILHWTGGHPYLTQHLCQAVAEALSFENRKSKIENSQMVDRVCQDLFLSATAREQDDNLIFVRERLLRSEEEVAAVLDLYAGVRRGRTVPNDETNTRVSVLRLSGIVRVAQGCLRVRNRIYERVFDLEWVQDNLPEAEAQRQRRAYRRGVLRTAAVAGVILAAMSALAVKAVRETAAARRSARQLQVALNAAENSENKAKRETVRATGETERARKAETKAEERRTQADLQKKEAQRLAGIANAKTAEANRARQDATDKLRLAYLAEAQARRISGRPGQQLGALQLLRKLAALRPDPALRAKMRDEAIAAMALPSDAVPEVFERRTEQKPFTWRIDFAQGRRYRMQPDGTCRILRLQDAREIGRIPAIHGSIAGIGRTSPDGRYVVFAVTEHAFRNYLWDIEQRKTVWQYDRSDSVPWFVRMDFSPDSRWMAVVTGGRNVDIRDLPSGKTRKTLAFPLDVEGLRLNRDGRKLAVALARAIHICDLESGSVKVVPTSAKSSDLSWHPDGRRLVGNADDANVYLWDTAEGVLLAKMEGHRGRSQGVEFNHRGDLVVSLGWDGDARLWNPTTGRQVFSFPAPGGEVTFSPDDQRMAIGGGGPGSVLSIWSMALPPVCRMLHGHARENWTAEFSPDGRLIAVGTTGKVELWDVDRGWIVAEVPDDSRTALFSRDARSLYTASNAGVRTWAIDPDPERPEELRIREGPRLPDLPAKGTLYAALSHDGRRLAVTRAQQIYVHTLNEQKTVAMAASHPGLDKVSLSPDGRWLASGSWSDGGAKVWDAQTGHLVFTPCTGLRVRPVFSADGRWLVTCEPDEYRFWRCGTWQTGPVLPMERGWGQYGAIAFANDTSLMAIISARNTIELYDTDMFQRVAQLESPEQVDLGWLSFAPDGERLAALSNGNRLHIWDLRQLRHRLASMGLDWDAPPFPPMRDQGQRSLVISSVVSSTQGRSQKSLERRYREEINDASYWVHKNPTDSESHQWLARYLATGAPRLRDLPKALKHALRACELAPNDPNCLSSLGAVYYRLGQYDKAVSTLNETVRKRGWGSGYDLYFLAMAQHKLGDTRKARESFDGAVRWLKQQVDPYPHWIEDMQVYRAEAEATLGIKTQR